MIATREAVDELAEQLEECRDRQAEIWDLFARDGDEKAEVVSYLVELTFSLSSQQVTEMEQAGGIPAASLTGAQLALLAQAEPLMRRLKFLRSEDAKLTESRLAFDSR